MLRGFTVLNPSGDSYTFTLERPEEMGVLINDITGLGPPKSNLILQSVYNQDGTRYNAARLENRQITFELQMIGDGVPASRRMIYSAFPIQQPVVITLHTDIRDYEARGYVEAVTPNIFSQYESVQVVVLCPQPYLTLPGNWEAGIPFETRAGGFEFPFQNTLNKTELEFNTTERVSSRSTFRFYDPHADGWESWHGVTVQPHARRTTPDKHGRLSSQHRYRARKRLHTRD